MIEEMFQLDYITCGQSYKQFTLVNYDSRVLPQWPIL